MKLHGAVIRDFARLLRRGGTLMFSTGEHEWEGVDDYHGAPMFWSHPEPRVTRQLVADAGLELEFAGVKEHGGERHYWVLALRPGA